MGKRVIAARLTLDGRLVGRASAWKENRRALEAGEVDELRLTFIPKISGRADAPTLTGPADAPLFARAVRLRLLESKQKGSETHVRYEVVR